MSNESTQRLLDLVGSLRGSSASDTAWALSQVQRILAEKPAQLATLQDEWMLVFKATRESAGSQSDSKYMELLGFASSLKRWTAAALGREWLAQGKTRDEAMSLGARLDSANWLELASRILDSTEWKRTILTRAASTASPDLTAEPNPVIRWINTLLLLAAWGLALARLCGWVQFSWWSIGAFFVLVHWAWPPLARKLYP